jgi:predicted phage terminase large subunit-like protein
VIENTELGRALSHELCFTGNLLSILWRPRFDKLACLLTQAARFEAGQVYLPQDAPWLGTYLEKLLSSSNRLHDDQVDPTSQALGWLKARTACVKPVQRRDIRRRGLVRR